VLNHHRPIARFLGGQTVSPIPPHYREIRVKAFTVVTVNVGSNTAITTTSNTGAQSLASTINLDQTDPQSRQRISAIGLTVTMQSAPPFSRTHAAWSCSIRPTIKIVAFGEATEIVRRPANVVETQ
jgi:hypothetical protein